MATVRLSTAGKTKLPGCDVLKTRVAIAPVETKPMKLVGVATNVCVEIAPSMSVAVSTTAEATKLPCRSEPKNVQPMALAPPLRLKKVIASVSVWVDNAGLATVPTPKKPVALLAL